ncbi:hypothetical protein BC834DRAFT_865050 [Gloeopeniophorella convolvens]|nr:hypothetical protein BC834DRAFT_865050 [Gloeopeniophorella convolvens]
MSLVARAPALRQQILRARIAAPARGVHGYKHMPFNYESKGPFGAKVAVFLAVGFTLPGFAAWYSIRKSGGNA